MWPFDRRTALEVICYHGSRLACGDQLRFLICSLSSTVPLAVHYPAYASFKRPVSLLRWNTKGFLLLQNFPPDWCV